VAGALAGHLLFDLVAQRMHVIGPRPAHRAERVAPQERRRLAKFCSDIWSSTPVSPPSTPPPCILANGRVGNTHPIGSDPRTPQRVLERLIEAGAVAIEGGGETEDAEFDHGYLSGSVRRLAMECRASTSAAYQCSLRGPGPASLSKRGSDAFRLRTAVSTDVTGTCKSKSKPSPETFSGARSLALKAADPGQRIDPSGGLLGKRASHA
jgi:hypothetical protein